jgi:AcrR family transcriptional regulator
MKEKNQSQLDSRDVAKPLSARAIKESKTDIEVRLRRSHSERREEAEQRMIEAAVTIVAERGLEELTLAECGQAAGYSRGLAAHYFGCKEDLTAAIATHIVGDYTRRLQSGGRAKRGLQGLIDTVAFYMESGRGNLRTLRAFHAVLGSALKQSKLSTAIARLNRDSTAGFAALIRDGMERGEIRADVDPSAQAALILAALRGAMSQWMLDPDHLDLDAIKEAITGNLRRSLAL